MHPAIRAITNALAYAKFQDEGVSDATQELLAQLGQELQEEDYEPGLMVEKAVTELNEAINSADESDEEVAGVVSKARHGDLDSDEDDEG